MNYNMVQYKAEDLMADMKILECYQCHRTMGYSVESSYPSTKQFVYCSIPCQLATKKKLGSLPLSVSIDGFDQLNQEDMPKLAIEIAKAMEKKLDLGKAKGTVAKQYDPVLAVVKRILNSSAKPLGTSPAPVAVDKVDGQAKLKKREGEYVTPNSAEPMRNAPVPNPRPNAAYPDSVPKAPASAAAPLKAATKPHPSTAAPVKVAPKPLPSTAPAKVAPKPLPSTAAPVHQVAPKPLPSTDAPVHQVAPKPLPSTAAPVQDAPKPLPSTAPVKVAPKLLPSTAPVKVAPKPLPSTAPVKVAPKPLPSTAPVKVAPKPLPSTAAPVHQVAPKPLPSTAAPAKVASKPLPSAAPAQIAIKSPYNTSVLAKAPTQYARKIYNVYDMKIDPRICHGASLVVYHAYDGSKLHIGPEDPEPLIKFQYSVEKAVAEKRCQKLGGKEVPSRGEVFIARYCGGDYYRGLVTRVHEDKGEVEMEFIDYGDTETFKFNELLIPTEELMKEPLHGIAVILFGVRRGFKMTDKIAAMFEKDPVVVNFEEGRAKYGSGVVLNSVNECLNLFVLQSGGNGLDE